MKAEEVCPEESPRFFAAQATKAPFINAIFDREPLEEWVFGRVVLVGEAAHPTTPHALRSTNMAIADAGGLPKSAVGIFLCRASKNCPL